jgi:co-chaperonin GroES (HSP10)
MRAVGKNLVIQKIKEGTTATKGGLLLAESQRDDIRYIEGKVLHVGSEVVGVKELDTIFYDRHAGHKIEYNKETYYIIKLTDVVVVL